MRRRDERLRRSQRDLRWTGIVIAAILVFSAWLAAAAFNVSPGLDEQLCPDAERVSRDVIVILDATDHWSEIRKVAVRRELESVRSSLERFTRVSIHVVEPSNTPGSTARLVMCNPGSLQQIDDDSRRWWLPRWFVSNERIVQRYHDRFHATVDSVVAEIGEVSSQATSPIIETLRAAVVTSDALQPPEIILVSDMYQNTDLLSAYERPEWPVEVADSLADVYAQGTRRLAGARVTIFLLSPPDIVSDPDAIRRFWSRFFEAQDALLGRVERLEA